MSFASTASARVDPEFVLIGDPVAHSLSPIMHNTLYEELGKEKWPMSTWHYNAVQCPDEASAAYHIDLVRTGRYRGMNVTMPYKRLALELADFVDASADAAGGANVLVRDDSYKLRAYNTDGRGAIGAIERVTGMTVVGRAVVVCGTGPTSRAIAAAAAQGGARSVTLLSRSASKARSCVNAMASSLDAEDRYVLDGLAYDEAREVVAAADFIVDATPCGMNPEDEAVIDTSLLHEGQVVLDVVYAHGETALLREARERGAIALDGLEMLVEQAALSVEIWAENMALPLDVDRSIMRSAALHASK